MTWTTPKTDWTSDDLVAARDMNAIGENLATLKNPSTAAYLTAEQIFADTNGDFLDVDSTNLSLTITTSGGDVMVHFDGVLQRHSGRDTDNCFDIDVDGNRQGGEDGLMRTRIHGTRINESFSRLIRNLSAGSHTFKLQWRNWENVRIYPGAQFWVREI